MPRSIIALFGAFALFIASCGDDDDSAGPTTTEAPTTTSSDATTPTTSDPVDGWARCDNPEGFSIAYPGDWTTNDGAVTERCSLFDPEAFEACVQAEVLAVVKRQVENGIDLVSDGEMSKISYATYIAERLTGFGGNAPRNVPQDLDDYPVYRDKVASSGGTPASVAAVPKAMPKGMENSATAEPIRATNRTTTIAAASEAGISRSSAEATGEAISPVTTARQTGARNACPKSSAASAATMPVMISAIRAVDCSPASMPDLAAMRTTGGSMR